MAKPTRRRTALSAQQRTRWERAVTVKEMVKILAAAKPTARLYVGLDNGIAGVVDVEIEHYTGKGGGVYGLPTIMLTINHSELTQPPPPTRSDLLKQLLRMEQQSPPRHDEQPPHSHPARQQSSSRPNKVSVPRIDSRSTKV
jgi:hypothetical protein